MQNRRQSDRLSWGDTVFLNLEREGMPLNVACVCTFEGEVSFDAYVRFIQSKLPLVPRYLKRVVPEPFGLGLPSWEVDPGFDLHRHVREVTLKHGTDTELKAVAAKLFSQVMDRQHPLWDLTLIHGLKGNRTGLIIRMHHCLTDGIAGVGIVSALLDVSPEVPHLPRKKLHIRVPSTSRDPLSSLASGVVDSYSEFVKRILSAWTDLLGIAERAAANNGGSLATDELSRLLPEMTTSAERLRFNVIYRGPQKFAWAKVPLADVKAIRETCGTSVNDVLLALVTATIQRYSELHGDRVKGRQLRMMVPVNLRGSDDNPGELGNRISLVPVTIPLDIRNLRKLLVAVHQRTELLKQAHAAEFVSLAGGLIGILPGAFQAFAGPMMSRLPITPFNMVCTSVPGPQYPLYLLGHKMLQWYPYVPVGGEMAVNCAILTYNGTVHFGFSGDVHAAPDLQRLEEFLKASFEELRDTVRPPAKKALGPKKARTKSQRTSRPERPAVRVSVPLAVPSASAASPHESKRSTEQQEVAARLIPSNGWADVPGRGRLWR
jgi:WS/DGAT/MGAT family acyltransferase